MTINNFFAHWIKEIDIKQYGDEISILQLINTVDTYKYSDAMLKFEEDDALKTYQHHLLYSKKKKVKLPTGKDRRSHKTNDAKLAKEQMIISMIELINLQTNFKLNFITEFL